MGCAAFCSSRGAPHLGTAYLDSDSDVGVPLSMLKRIAENTVVTMTYQLHDGSGALLEERTPEAPCSFIAGLGQILPAVEAALMGQMKGYATSLILPAERAYGVYRKELRAHVSRQSFPSEIKLEKGMRFSTSGPNGEPVVVTIIDVVGDRITIDGNHPLAGKELRFDLKVLDVRAATEEEVRLQQVLRGAGNTTFH